MNSNQRRILFIAAVLGFLCVALGAFGAHALGEQLSESARYQFELGIRYAFYHTLAILAAGLALPIASRPRHLILGANFLILGVVLFSGSLLLLAVTQLKYFAMLTPFGGVCLLCGWLLFAYAMLATRAAADK